MGPLFLTVQIGNKVVGRAKVADVTAVAGEPYSKPVNGWFSIIAPAASEGEPGKQLGELNLSVVLENAPNADNGEEEDVADEKDAERIKDKVRHQDADFNTEAEHTQDEISMTEDSFMGDLQPAVFAGAGGRVAEHTIQSTSKQTTTAVPNVRSSQYGAGGNHRPSVNQSRPSLPSAANGTDQTSKAAPVDTTRTEIVGLKQGSMSTTGSHDRTFNQPTATSSITRKPSMSTT
jgi:hypothetical protein